MGDLSNGCLVFVLSTIIAAAILMLGLSLLHVHAGFWGCLVVVFAMIVAVRIGNDS